MLKGRPLIIWGGGLVRIFANEIFFGHPKRIFYIMFDMHLEFP